MHGRMGEGRIFNIAYLGNNSVRRILLRKTYIKRRDKLCEYTEKNVSIEERASAKLLDGEKSGVFEKQ